MDLNPLVDAHELKASANRGVLDGPVPIDIFYFGIGNTAVVVEERRQVTARYVTALVDGGREYGAAVLPVPYRVVGATPEKRNA
jgi:hypothetical protein